MAKPLIVGELNPYGGDPYFALYPSPRNCSGERLCRLVLAMQDYDYLETFDRVNLCAGTWSAKIAKGMARDIVASRERIILLGKKVATAFGIKAAQPFSVHDNVLILPHPSGLCRLWNDPGAFRRARDCVAKFLPHVAHLLGGLYK